MKYRLYIHGVWYDDFRTIKDIDKYLFEHNLDNSNYQIDVKKIHPTKKKKEKK